MVSHGTLFTHLTLSLLMQEKLGKKFEKRKKHWVIILFHQLFCYVGPHHCLIRNLLAIIEMSLDIRCRFWSRFKCHIYNWKQQLTLSWHQQWSFQCQLGNMEFSSRNLLLGKSRKNEVSKNRADIFKGIILVRGNLFSARFHHRPGLIKC